MVFHTVGTAFDDDGVAVVVEAVEDGGGDGGVTIEDGGPLLELMPRTPLCTIPLPPGFCGSLFWLFIAMQRLETRPDSHRQDHSSLPPPLHPHMKIHRLTASPNTKSRILRTCPTFTSDKASDGGTGALSPFSGHP